MKTQQITLITGTVVNIRITAVPNLMGNLIAIVSFTINDKPVEFDYIKHLLPIDYRRDLEKGLNEIALHNLRQFDLSPN